MAKFLLVGDVHATPDEIEDCEALVKLIENEALMGKLGGYDYLVFLGDQAHNHAILNVHVLDFWKRTFLRLRPHFKQIICLVGNHDLPGNTGDTTINSMSTLDNLCLVVNESLLIEDVLFVGFQHDDDKFIKICNDNQDVQYVFCHQTFNGAKYENGYPALDGIDLDLLPPKQGYISGHIHTPQSFDRVRYVGAPRWRTMTDAKVILRWLYYFKSDIGVLNQSVETGTFCKRKLIFDVTPTSTMPAVPEMKAGDTTYLNYIGPESWLGISRRLTTSNNMIIKKFFPTDSRPIQVKESEGIDKALMKYVDSATTQTPKDVLKKMIEERLWNQR